MLVINGEYRFRLVDAVQGVVFMDFGNAWEDEAMDLTDLMRGYGAGIRLDTPWGLFASTTASVKTEDRLISASANPSRSLEKRTVPRNL